ncbi:hypothetical protein PU560_17095 [Georgenia sp. 10Sc9-8]|uniref:Uncharacterized protein n=1 Tax=Georgenia halotolerans TaxID=3028317 RepID=A0ABT5U4W9_9MICO|nr:hypothetical protein [Georgenia halotolerans]
MSEYSPEVRELAKKVRAKALRNLERSTQASSTATRTPEQPAQTRRKTTRRARF